MFTICQAILHIFFRKINIPFTMVSSIFGGIVVVGMCLNCELHMLPVQQQKFIFFGFDVSTHSVLLHVLSEKHPFIFT